MRTLHNPKLNSMSSQKQTPSHLIFNKLDGDPNQIDNDSPNGCGIDRKRNFFISKNSFFI